MANKGFSMVLIFENQSIKSLVKKKKILFVNDGWLFIQVKNLFFCHLICHFSLYRFIIIYYYYNTEFNYMKNRVLKTK